MTETARRILGLFDRHPQFFVRDVHYYGPLTIEQMDRYADLLNWSGIHSDEGYFGLSLNDHLPWSKELVDRYIDRWDWYSLSFSMIGYKLWFNGLLSYYEERIDWTQLCTNTQVPWTNDLIEQFSHRIDWEAASGNQFFPWSVEILDRYQSRLNFDRMSSSLNSLLCKHRWRSEQKSPGGMDFLERLTVVEKYENKLDWENLNWDWISGLTKEEFDFVLGFVLDLSKQKQ